MLQKNTRAGTVDALMDRIGAGCNPHDEGPEVVRVVLWDLRVVVGTYFDCGPKELDVVDHNSDVIFDNRKLQPFVSRLLDKGMPFVTETGSHDMICTLRWTIVAGAGASE